jgi:cell division protein FtsA
MNKPIIITGLDIGSSKVSAVALELFGAGHSTILAYESQPSRGVCRGVFTDIAEASNSVAKVLTRLGEKTGKRPDNIYANISGESIKGEKSKGMIPLSSRGREVTNSDIERCINAASTIRLIFDREVIHRIVLNFSIDDQPGIKNAFGLYASRLYCEVYMITANVNHIQNIYKCINNAGYDLKEVIYSGIADGMSMLEDPRDDGCAVLINTGASVTELSIFSGGAMAFLDVISAGANDIKGALKESAEFNNITARLKSGIEEFFKKGGNIKSVIIAGGLAFREGAAEMLEERLGYPVKMGIVRNVKGNISSIDSLRAVTAIGLAKCASFNYQPRSTQAKNLARNISNKVVEIFNNYF